MSALAQTYEGDADDFAAHYGAGRPQLVWRRVVADLETPVSAMLRPSFLYAKSGKANPITPELSRVENPSASSARSDGETGRRGETGNSLAIFSLLSIIHLINF